MGAEIALAAAALQAFGGFQSMRESSKQADIAIQQAETRAREEERVAARQAEEASEEADIARRKQKVAFLASGVDLSGSPLLLMEETRAQGEENVQEILKAGQFQQTATRTSGYTQARQLKSKGRQAFFSSLSGSAGTAAPYF